MEANLPEGEMGFEPQTRARSNTWPLPRPDNYEEGGLGGKCEGAEAKCAALPAALPPGAAALKKNSSRRNAWGNFSYADLITQAIGSSPNKRLTLSQIYEWMVHNVAYFKDKGDSNSSAGWKVNPPPLCNTLLRRGPLLYINTRSLGRPPSPLSSWSLTRKYFPFDLPILLFHIVGSIPKALF
jgi:hypothetical protein